ncbi:integrase, partial [bacterium]|nr:integrase [bacterium]
GKTFGLFDTGETTEVAMNVLYKWIENYGIPGSIYVDYKSLYHARRKATLEEQLEGIEPATQFGKVCQKLGIELIFANSPQAKGRVERSNGILQDRLVKMMRLKNIKSIEDANNYLLNEFWEEYNAKFEKMPACPEDGHVKLLEGQDLDNLICIETKRKVSNDYIVRNNNRFFQLKKKQEIRIAPRASVNVQIRLDHSVHIYYKGTPLNFSEFFADKSKEVYNTA